MDPHEQTARRIVAALSMHSSLESEAVAFIMDALTRVAAAARKEMREEAAVAVEDERSRHVYSSPHYAEAGRCLDAIRALPIERDQ
jgi:hypothetical protein